MMNNHTPRKLLRRPHPTRASRRPDAALPSNSSATRSSLFTSLFRDDATTSCITPSTKASDASQPAMMRTKSAKSFQEREMGCSSRHAHRPCVIQVSIRFRRINAFSIGTSTINRRNDGGGAATRCRGASFAVGAVGA